MSWGKFDDGYSDHPKVVEVGPLGELLQVRAILWANRFLTNGHINRGALAQLGRGFERLRLDGKPVLVDSLVDTMVRACLWERDGDGWLIHDFLEYQPSRAQRKKERDEATAYMAEWRQQKKLKEQAETAKADGHVRLA